MAWLHQHPDLNCAPFLNITAPTKRAGKTTLLDIVAEIVPRPLPLVGVSEAFLFRVIEQHAPTLLLDEIDAQRAKKNAEGAYLDGMLNGSQSRRTAIIGRMTQVRDGNAVEQVPVYFSTWCPKVLCGIGGLADTTVDRCIQIKLERKPPDVTLPRWRSRDREAVGELRRQLMTWAERHADEIVAARERVRLPETINDREWDSWEVLGAVAVAAKGEWPRRAKAACRAITAGSDDTRSAGEQALADVREAFNALDDPEFLPYAKITEQLNWREDRPWATWQRGKMLTSMGLSKLLKPFGLRAELRRYEGEPKRGYDLAAIDPVSKRYAVTDSEKDEPGQGLKVVTLRPGSHPEEY